MVESYKCKRNADFFVVRWEMKRIFRGFRVSKKANDYIVLSE